MEGKLRKLKDAEFKIKMMLVEIQEEISTYLMDTFETDDVYKALEERGYEVTTISPNHFVAGMDSEGNEVHYNFKDHRWAAYSKCGSWNYDGYSLDEVIEQREEDCR